jgi:hypothetical protein
MPLRLPSTIACFTTAFNASVMIMNK